LFAVSFSFSCEEKCLYAAKIAGNDELMFLLTVEKCEGAFFIQFLNKLFKGTDIPQATNKELNLNANFCF